MNKYIVRNLLRKVQTMTPRGCFFSKKPKSQNHITSYYMYEDLINEIIGRPPPKLSNHTTSCHLSEDLIDEIIGRLPPKSLIRFRSLSKSWCSTISSPNFIRKHTIRSVRNRRKNSLIRQRFHYNKDGVSISYRLHPEDPYRNMKFVKFPCMNSHIICSSFGVILMYKKKIYPSITLWNPSIKRKYIVPNVPHHPSGSFSVVFGFGFDPVVEDYKIVGLSYGSTQTSFHYSMKTTSWSEIVLPTLPPFEVASLPCFVDGALHWVVKSKASNIEDSSYIITFDLSSHVFDVISLPRPNWVTIHLTIIKGFLAVISSDGSDSWIWMRRNYNNVACWSKAFRITSTNGFDSDGVDSVFQLNNCLKDCIDQDPYCGEHFMLVVFSDSSYAVDMDICIESLELLDKETC